MRKETSETFDQGKVRGKEGGREGGREGKRRSSPGVAVGELVDAAAGEFFRVVFFNLLVRHAVTYACKELIEVVPCLEGGREGGRGEWNVSLSFDFLPLTISSIRLPPSLPPSLPPLFTRGFMLVHWSSSAASFSSLITMVCLGIY